MPLTITQQTINQIPCTWYDLTYENPDPWYCTISGMYWNGMYYAFTNNNAYLEFCLLEEPYYPLYAKITYTTRDSEDLDWRFLFEGLSPSDIIGDTGIVIRSIPRNQLITPRFELSIVKEEIIPLSYPHGQALHRIRFQWTEPSITRSISKIEFCSINEPILFFGEAT